MNECEAIVKRRLVINILTFNRVSELAICLSSLINQTFQEWDILILDDCSSNKCSDYKFFNDIIGRLKSDGHGVRVVRHEYPWINIGKSRNHAVELSKKAFPNNTCEFICRIDDDSYCDANYLEKLYNIITDPTSKEVGAVGGVVPVFGNPNLYRRVPKIFNEVKWDKEGNITHLGDDGGCDYNYFPLKGTPIIPSHHLRSSFMFRTKLHDKEPHPLEYGMTGYREETDLTLRWRWAGWKLLTDVSAVCYHQQARSGGARMDPRAYHENAVRNDKHFKKKMKLLFNKQGGAPKC